MQSPPRSFLVHIEDDRRHCRTIEGASFEEAAIGFAEDLHLAEDEVRIIVIDPADGRRHCFTVDLGAGGAEACA
jgi:hypothetical protein